MTFSVLETALSALRSGNHDKAEMLCRSVVEGNSGNDLVTVNALCLLGATLLYKKEIAEGKKYFDAALSHPAAVANEEIRKAVLTRLHSCQDVYRFAAQPETQNKTVDDNLLAVMRATTDMRTSGYAHHADSRRFSWEWKEINYNRISILGLLTSKRSDAAYLEIGCASNVVFDSIPLANKVGVDPAAGGTLRMTSDDFFRINTSFFDVIFIDGLHTYEQVRKDIINALRILKPNGWIAIHDVLPRDWIEQHVPCVSGGVWTGNVWKVAFELVKTAGIDFKIITIDHGVGVFRVTGENVTLHDMTAELHDKEFAYLYENISLLPLIEWSDAQQWLRG